MTLPLNELHLRQELSELGVQELQMLLWQVNWHKSSHDYQRWPAGDWSVWLLLAGRGAGKTRTAAEVCGWRAVRYPNLRCLVAAPTHSDVRDTCFEGDSGLMSVVPKDFVADYNRSLSELRLKNGSFFKGISATEPDRFRGPQWHMAWCDELASWMYLEEAWQLLRLSVRLKSEGGFGPTRTIATTTPRPLAFLRNLAKEESTVVTRASTHQNLDNLDESFRREVLRHEGTRYGQQEIYGEILADDEGGIFKRSWFKLWSHSDAFPIFDYIVQSWDTAFSEKDLSPSPLDRKLKEPDFTACTTWGVFKRKRPEPVPGRHDPVSPWAVMLLDAWREHISFPDLRRRALSEFNTKYGPKDQARKPDVVLVENKGSGISLLQELRQAGVPVQEYNPQRDSKLQRANVVSHLPANGLIYLPESPNNLGQPRTWIEPWLDELCSFGPMTLDRQKDDFVDSTTQAWKVLIDRDLVTVDPVPEPEIIDRYVRAQREGMNNPYAP